MYRAGIILPWQACINMLASSCLLHGTVSLTSAVNLAERLNSIVEFRGFDATYDAATGESLTAELINYSRLTLPASNSSFT